MATNNTQLELLLKLNDQLSKQIATVSKSVVTSGRAMEEAEKRLNKETAKTTAALKKQGTAAKKTGAKMGDLGNYAVGRLASQLGPAGAAIADMTMLFTKLGPVMGTVGVAALAMGGAVAANAKAFSFATEKGREFTQEMANLNAILQPTTEASDAMAEATMKIGEATKFTASQAAQAFTELGKLGFGAGQILAAGEDVVSFAAATGQTMAESAKVAASSLRQFGLVASDTQQVVDTIAKSFTISALGAENFGDAMKYAGPLANAAGMSIQETTAALGVLANNAIKGSQAGTGMRRMLALMNDETSKVSKILATRGIPATATFTQKMEELGKIGLTVTSATDLFGMRTATAAIVLSKSTDTLKDYNEQLKWAEGGTKGFTQAMADIQMDTLDGDIKKAESALEGLGIRFFNTFGPQLRVSVQNATKLIGSIQTYIVNNEKEVRQWGNNFIGIINAMIDGVDLLIDAWKVANKIIDAINPFEDISKELEPINQISDAIEKVIKLQEKLDKEEAKASGSTGFSGQAAGLARLKSRQTFIDLSNARKEMQAMYDTQKEVYNTARMLRNITSEQVKEEKLLDTMFTMQLTKLRAKAAAAEKTAEALKKAASIAPVGRPSVAAPGGLDISDMLKDGGGEKPAKIIQDIYRKIGATQVKMEDDKLKQLRLKNSNYLADMERRYTDAGGVITDAQFFKAVKALDTAQKLNVTKVGAGIDKKEKEKEAKKAKELSEYLNELEISSMIDGKEKELAEVQYWNDKEQEAHKDNAEVLAAITQASEAKRAAIKEKYAMEEAQMRVQVFGQMNSALFSLYQASESKNKALRVGIKASMMGEAAANSYLAGTKALSTIPFPFNIAAMGAVIGSGLAQVLNIKNQKFAQGGIVQGPRSGDTVPIMANGGEMIFNESQQAALWGMVNNGGSGGKGGGSSVVIENITVSGASGGRSMKSNFKEDVRTAMWELQEEGVL